MFLECACKADKPCSCGYSPEQCAVHCSKSRPCNSGYVLPVRYDTNGGDYVVYELPQDVSTQQLSRAARQTPTTSDAIQDLFSRDSPFKAAVDRIRDRISKLRRNDASESTLSSTFDTSSLRNKLSDRISSIADFFTQNFALPPTRRRREATTTEAERRDLMDKRIPMLRVKEYEASPGNYDDLSKYTTTSRVKLSKADDQQETLRESDGIKHCHECGTELSSSVCTRCGSHQSQYVEYSTGKPVPFYPGAKSVTQPNVESRSPPRYIFDRYGHKYIENNGNLRLIVPQQHQEAMVGDQPDFAGLADILNANEEVIRQLNPAPGRVMPEPMDIATDAISLVHDLANREPEKRSAKYERAATAAAAAEEGENEKKEERHFPRTMYQVVPMRYEGKDGKLVVKVYSSKSDNANTIPAAETAATDAEKSKPTVHMLNKDNKQFEILSFEDYQNSSNEDIRQVLEHLHGKQSW